MPKLLQAIAGAPHGGAENFFTRLSIGLEEAGQDQTVVIRKDDERVSVLRDGGVEPTQLSFGGVFDLITTSKLRHIINSYQPDIVLTWMNRATSKMPSGPFIHAARLGGYYDLKYYKKCDHLIGNTPKIVDYLVKNGWPVERSHYIPNFVDECPGKPINRSVFDTPERSPLIIALGRLHPNKAFDVLLKAMVEVPEAFLWLAGDGNQLSKLMLLATEIGVRDRVRFLGWRSDVRDLIATADALVCSSRHEPLGNVIIEGWAQGKPVIATESDGPVHLIEHGENGLLSPIDKPSLLASSIKAVLFDPQTAQALALSGHAAFETRFTKSKVISQYKDFFLEITT